MPPPLTPIAPLPWGALRCRCAAAVPRRLRRAVAAGYARGVAATARRSRDSSSRSARSMKSAGRTRDRGAEPARALVGRTLCEQFGERPRGRALDGTDPRAVVHPEQGLHAEVAAQQVGELGRRVLADVERVDGSAAGAERQAVRCGAQELAGRAQDPRRLGEAPADVGECSRT